MLLLLYFNENILLEEGNGMNALFTIVLGIFGAIAAVKPEKILKPAILENPTRVKIVRIAGGLLAVCAVLQIIFLIGASY